MACWLPLTLAACASSSQASVPAGPARAAASPAPAASAPAPAAPSPSAYPDDPAGSRLPFQCQRDESGSGPPVPPVPAISAVRAATHPGFDRFVIQFTGASAAYRIQPQSNAAFTLDTGRGGLVTLQGAAGLRVVMTPASAHDTYSGPTDLVTGFPALREAAQVGDYEGYTTWALGLARPACYRAFTLAGPARLVIDVQQ
jgi:hypothetical protein